MLIAALVFGVVLVATLVVLSLRLERGALGEMNGHYAFCAVSAAEPDVDSTPGDGTGDVPAMQAATLPQPPTGPAAGRPTQEAAGRHGKRKRPPRGGG